MLQLEPFPEILALMLYVVKWQTGKVIRELLGWLAQLGMLLEKRAVLGFSSRHLATSYDSRAAGRSWGLVITHRGCDSYWEDT